MFFKKKDGMEKKGTVASKLFFQKVLNWCEAFTHMDAVRLWQVMVRNTLYAWHSRWYPHAQPNIHSCTPTTPENLLFCTKEQWLAGSYACNTSVA